MTDEYISSIPETAVEQIVERYADGTTKRAEYLVDGKVISHRWFDEAGELGIETPLKNGLNHGIQYWWDSPGHLSESYSYVDGLEHGTHKQFSRDGQLVGTYTMEHGTGIDLWWGAEYDGVRYLSEVHYMKDGERHGFEWWLWGDDQGRLSEEYHFDHGEQHGIQRSWNNKGRLRRGYPRYFVHDQQVNKAKYIRACASDPSLPPFRAEDNDPHREFPPEIQPHLGPR